MKVLQNSFGQCIEFHCILLYFRSSDDMKVLQNVVGFGECWTLYSICIVFHRIVLYDRSSNDMKVLQNSVVLGESANVGEPGFQWVKELEQSYYFPRSLPLSWDQ